MIKVCMKFVFGGSYRPYLIKYISLYGGASITGASCLLSLQLLIWILTFYGQMLRHSVYFEGNLICVIIVWSFVKKNQCMSDVKYI